MAQTALASELEVEPLNISHVIQPDEAHQIHSLLADEPRITS